MTILPINHGAHAELFQAVEKSRPRAINLNQNSLSTYSISGEPALRAEMSCGSTILRIAATDLFCWGWEDGEAEILHTIKQRIAKPKDRKFVTREFRK